MADISQALDELAALPLDNSQLLARIQSLCPAATMPEIMHATFRAVVEISYRDCHLSDRLYDFALAIRGSA